MFCGDWLHSAAHGYVPRNCADGDKWTHWKLRLVRERYSDCALVDVEITFFFARKVNGRWVSGRKPQFKYSVSLGNLNHVEDSARLRTVDGWRSGPLENNPHIVRELRRAIAEIEQCAEKLAKKGEPISTGDLNVSVWVACQKGQKESREKLAA